MERGPAQFKHVNKVSTSGETSAVDIRFTRRGQILVTLTILTRQGERSEFSRCIAFGEQAEKASRLKVGAFVEVTSHLQTRSWDDPRTGQTKYFTDVVVDGLSVQAEQPALPLTADFNRDTAE